MAHSYVSNLMHCVFSTKERCRIITPDLQERLWPFIGGIARQNGMKALAIGGKVLHQEARRGLCDMGHLAEGAWVEALEHPDSHIRWHAARALSQIGDPRAVEVLAEGLHDPNYSVRWTTARVLASMDSTAIPAILQLIAHRPMDEPFRQACYHALHAMPSPRTQEYIQPLLEALNSSTAPVQAPQLAHVMLREWKKDSDQ